MLLSSSKSNIPLFKKNLMKGVLLVRVTFLFLLYEVDLTNALYLYFMCETLHATFTTFPTEYVCGNTKFQ